MMTLLANVFGTLSRFVLLSSCMNINRRWYDIDSTLSLAVSLLEKAEKSVQLVCAGLIKDKSHCFGIYIDANKLEDSFNYFLKRWYDEDKEIADAFEYLKLMPLELQKEMALEIIDRLQGAKID